MKIMQSILFFISSVLFLFSTACINSDPVGTVSGVATVTGTITFRNFPMWPDSGVVQVTIFPQGVWTANGPTGPSQNANTPTILLRNANTNQYNYFIPDLPEGEYSALTVGWRHPDETLPEEQRTAFLGVYLNGSNTVSTGLDISGSPFQGPLPAVLNVNNDLGGRSFTADFANIQLFFPPDPNGK